MRSLWSKRIFFPEIFLVVLVTTAWPQMWPQQTSTPALHRRSHAEDGPPDPTANSGQATTLPEGVSGAYDFDHVNESIELDIVRNKLSGYISRLGDAETDSNTPLTFFFDQSSIDGAEISFQTRVVHGVWYSFRGTILRGEAKTRGDEGYYVLHGVLEIHHPQSGYDKSADEMIERRTVNFKSMQQ